MFTIEQIQTAHAKVKSGADFPEYINALKILGVKQYHTYVSDGHTDYYGARDYSISSTAKYSSVFINTNSEINVFKTELLAHQEGKTDYMTFIMMCADTGIKKWIVNLEAMCCTYYDLTDSIVLKENFNF